MPTGWRKRTSWLPSIWAVFYGIVLFGDFPDFYNWLGAGIVVVAGILMILRDRALDRSLV